ncbi:peptidoglycan recognition family protein [Nonomuraea sp. NPDC048882]|uniref:peptidoglycan recognition protein family protein n=1 Tax=Nonomuraea sp. NPDC048882 TaxID=3154347 RepID=UPI0033D48294
MNITPREAFGWGPTDARAAHPSKGIVIHYDGSNLGLAAKAHTACIAYWQRTRVFHMTDPDREWLDIGYSFGACPHGSVFEGRGLGREQAAQPGGNTTWYSVTLMSGPGEQPTDAQIDAVRQLRMWLIGKGLGGQVRGHRDFVSTTCPGDRAYALVKNGTFSGAPNQQEEDMSAKEIYEGAWEQDRMPVSYGSPTNLEWKPRSVLVDHGVQLRKILAELAAQGATIRELVAVLAQRDQAIDVDALVGRIESAIEGITVRLDVANSA